MRNTLIGILLGVLLLASGERLHEAWKWKQAVDERGWKAEQAYLLTSGKYDAKKGEEAWRWLAEPVGRTPTGQVITRAMLIDAVLAASVKKGK